VLPGYLHTPNNFDPYMHYRQGVANALKSGYGNETYICKDRAKIGSGSEKAIGLSICNQSM